MKRTWKGSGTQEDKKQREENEEEEDKSQRDAKQIKWKNQKIKIN